MKNLSFALIFLNLIFYAGEIPTPFLVLSWSVFVIGFFLFRKFNHSLSGKLIRRAVTTAFLILGLVLIKSLFKPLLTVESTLSLLLLLLVLKLYELENYEDYFHLFLITVLVQCGILLLNPTFFTLVFSLVNIVLTFVFVIKINQYQLGSINFKRLLLYLLPALPLCFLLFFFFPRFTSGFMRLQDTSTVTSGMNPEINFMSLGPMNLDTKTAFKANLDSNENLSPRELYWRSTVLWDTDGVNWTEGHYSLKSNVNQETPKPRGKSISYQLVLEDTTQIAIPVLDYPLSIDLDSLRLDSFRDQTYRFKHLMLMKKVIRVKSNVATTSHEFDQIIRRRSLRVKKYSYPRLQQFLTELYQGIDSKDQKLKLELLKDLFQNKSFSYSLNPPPYNSIEEFILESRIGYCSHFAVSFALLARLSGIPARVVNGYQGGSYNDFGKFYTIEAKDAHAWVEIFDKDTGWTRVDPTELVFPVRVNLGMRATLDQLNPYLQFAQIKFNRKAFEFELFIQAQLITSMVNNHLSTWFYEFDQDSQKFLSQKLGLRPKNLSLFLVVIFMLVLGAIYGLMRFYQRQHQFDQEVKKYQKFIKQMENLGLKRFPYEGPLHFKQRCLECFPQKSVMIEQAINGFIEARYQAPNHQN